MILKPLITVNSLSDQLKQWFCQGCWFLHQWFMANPILVSFCSNILMQNKCRTLKGHKAWCFIWSSFNHIKPNNDTRKRITIFFLFILLSQCAVQNIYFYNIASLYKNDNIQNNYYYRFYLQFICLRDSLSLLSASVRTSSRFSFNFRSLKAFFPHFHMWGIHV